MSWPVDLLTLQLAATEDGRTPPPPIQAIQRSRGRVQFRSEERRVGKKGRFRWAPDHLKKKKVEMEEVDKVVFIRCFDQFGEDTLLDEEFTKVWFTVAVRVVLIVMCYTQFVLLQDCNYRCY